MTHFDAKKCAEDWLALVMSDFENGTYANLSIDDHLADRFADLPWDPRVGEPVEQELKKLDLRELANQGEAGRMFSICIDEDVLVSAYDSKWPSWEEFLQSAWAPEGID